MLKKRKPYVLSVTKKRPIRTIGATTGLGVLECWIMLFEENERRYASRVTSLPRTDKQLVEFMYNEFPNQSIESFYRVSETRRRYNQGTLLLSHGEPVLESNKYNCLGQIMPRRFTNPKVRRLKNV